MSISHHPLPVLVPWDLCVTSWNSPSSDSLPPWLRSAQEGLKDPRRIHSRPAATGNRLNAVTHRRVSLMEIPSPSLKRALIFMDTPRLAHAKPSNMRLDSPPARSAQTHAATNGDEIQKALIYRSFDSHQLITIPGSTIYQSIQYQVQTGQTSCSMHSVRPRATIWQNAEERCDHLTSATNATKRDTNINQLGASHQRHQNVYSDRIFTSLHNRQAL